MHAGRTAAVALAGAATVSLAAPAAWASVAPQPVQPGQILLINDDSRCDDMTKGAKATSPLFGTVVLAAGVGHMSADVRVPVTAKPGSYRVTIRCGDHGTTTTSTVRVPGEGTPVPVMGAKAGLGGSVMGGSGMSEVADGAVLLALAGGATVLVLRRRPKADGD
ncbi:MULTISPECIES: hypothetical protein [Streptomycetaceae]|uniref:Uncharacterized protein n=1 Tax=Streptantibioticus cattleyicolor (strain ATCC 35852 / DSM 46488 / JCM 4925 / NBRC 14057 / NRRL 8057) TaxID=1003195 RepID=F8K1G1_STREN|nr:MULTISPECIES: hypothetical protein [Streptomycetaceae]AEW97457.1 hypothetical protein SCATT_50860 [Streptantibioticus cattleyicolor NRRL 8057 = DSM 46488]MYS61892.1 hypothetical protein [Streptomyces sp. SID5468]CCB77776.1 conserved exported protein of unknown function [Streptantibioticus cattleyicolor NRRL 8057 = DSM 46488]